MRKFIEWLWPETKIRTLYPSELAIMQEIWGNTDGKVCGQEIVNIFEKRCGWNPEVIRAILDKKLVRMKKYLRKKPFCDIYVVRIGEEEGMGLQKEGWKKLKDKERKSSSSDPEISNEIKRIKEIMGKMEKR